MGDHFSVLYHSAPTTHSPRTKPIYRQALQKIEKICLKFRMGFHQDNQTSGPRRLSIECVAAHYSTPDDVEDLSRLRQRQPFQVRFAGLDDYLRPQELLGQRCQMTKHGSCTEIVFPILSNEQVGAQINTRKRWLDCRPL